LLLTAKSIVLSIQQSGFDSPDVIICGGGRLNGALMNAISKELGFAVYKSEDFGIDGDFLEAALLAWVAFCTVNGLPANVPTVTGASGGRVLGGVYS
jgi:anhydro-N-acetylmuramic acid kinase